MDANLPLESPSLSRRQLLNFLTGSIVATTAGTLMYPAAKFLAPPTDKSLGGAILAKDKLGNLIPASQITVEPAGTRALVAGLGGEPTYLIVGENGMLDSMGIVDNCTHLGCTFPWNDRAQQFQCPCHGSRYAPDGTVVRGPADRPLKLVRVEVESNSIKIAPWLDTDPRTGQKPWWV